MEEKITQKLREATEATKETEATDVKQVTDLKQVTEKNISEQTIPAEEAKKQVRQMGRMLAALYYHFSKEALTELGEEKGKELISKAVWAFGSERGLEQKERVLSTGHPYEPENYVLLPDLPSLGWDLNKVPGGENQTHIQINYCPFAEYWKEKNFEEIGRLYCSVDQAKYQAFHPESDYIHLQLALKGDSCCEMLCKRKENKCNK